MIKVTWEGIDLLIRQSSATAPEGDWALAQSIVETKELSDIEPTKYLRGLCSLRCPVSPGILSELRRKHS